MIEGGKILEDNLKKNKLTLDSLNQTLRQKDVFNIEEVEYALLEVNGQVSILKKKNYRTLTFQDIHKGNNEKERLPIELIMDGKMLKENPKLNNVSEESLLKQLKSRQKKISDVFYAVKGSNGRLYIDFYNDKLKHPIDAE